MNNLAEESNMWVTGRALERANSKCDWTSTLAWLLSCVGRFVVVVVVVVVKEEEENVGIDVVDVVVVLVYWSAYSGLLRVHDI